VGTAEFFFKKVKEREYPSLWQPLSKAQFVAAGFSVRSCEEFFRKLKLAATFFLKRLKSLNLILKVKGPGLFPGQRNVGAGGQW
jgi:hypothetical protein